MTERVVDKDPFGSARKQFERAFENHARRLREQIELARAQMHQAMEAHRSDMERHRAEFEREMEKARENMETRGWERAFKSTSHGPSSSKRRWRRRRPPEPEFGPVKPRPNPKPLMDGAEAPIE